MNVKWELPHFCSVKDLRGYNADPRGLPTRPRGLRVAVADPSKCPSPKGYPSPRAVEGFDTHGLGRRVDAALGARNGLSVRIFQTQHVSARTLRGRGLLNRSRNTRPNFRTLPTTPDQVRNLAGGVGWASRHVPNNGNIKNGEQQSPLPLTTRRSELQACHAGKRNI